MKHIIKKYASRIIDHLEVKRKPTPAINHRLSIIEDFNSIDNFISDNEGEEAYRDADRQIKEFRKIYPHPDNDYLVSRLEYSLMNKKQGTALEKACSPIAVREKACSQFDYLVSLMAKFRHYPVDEVAALVDCYKVSFPQDEYSTLRNRLDHKLQEYSKPHPLLKS